METLKNTYNRTLDLEDELGAHIAGSNKKLLSLSSKLDSLNTQQQNLQDQVSNVQTSVDTNTQNLSDLSTTVSTMQTTVDECAQQTNANQQSISTLNQTVQQNVQNVENLNSTVQTNSSMLESLSSTVSGVSQNLSTLQTSVEGVQQDVLTLETDLATANTNISNVQTLLTGKENITNKCYSLSANSTEEQYPSAKTVYDALQNLSSSVAVPTTYSKFFDFYTLANKGDASVTANRELYTNTVSFTAPKGTKVHIVAHVRTRSEINQQYHTYAFQVGLYVNSTKLLLFSSIKSDYPTIDENTLSGTFTATGGTDVIKVRLFSLNASSLTALVSALVEVSGPNITISE